MLRMELSYRTVGRGGHPLHDCNIIYLRKIMIFHTKYPKMFKGAPPPPQLEILDPPLLKLRLPCIY